MTPVEAMTELREGNIRFRTGNVTQTEPRDLVMARLEVSEEQHPIAVILGCSDSRVGPEMLFDQPIGKLFEVRTAGHVINDIEVGSIEYAIEHLHCPLIVVLGHERCGAITAAVESSNGDTTAPGEINEVLLELAPAVDETMPEDGYGDVTQEDHIKAATIANSLIVAEYLLNNSDIIIDAVKAGNLEVNAAYYDLDTGRVTLLDQEGD